MKILPLEVRSPSENYLHMTYKIVDKEDDVHTLELYAAHYAQAGLMEVYNTIMASTSDSVFVIETNNVVIGHPVGMGEMELGDAELGGYQNKEMITMIKDASIPTTTKEIIL